MLGWALVVVATAAALSPPHAIRPAGSAAAASRSVPPRLVEGGEGDLELVRLDDDDDEMAPPSPPPFSCESLAGISEPLGFFDPVGFSKDASEGRIRFYREVELKHGRVAMLAALGFPLAETFHPLFGGDIDVPSYVAFQETPLQTFWPLIIGLISVFEVFSIFSFNSPIDGGEMWSIRTDYESGDLGFDPMRLKPESAEEFKEMQTKELNNGRWAMIAMSGMVAQELVTGQRLFP